MQRRENFKNSSNSSTTTSSNVTPLKIINENITRCCHALKRSDSSKDFPEQNKRYRSENEPPNDVENQLPASNSASKNNNNGVMSIIAENPYEKNLIGDFSLPHVLPLIEGKHGALKSISAETMRKLLQGDYDDHVGSFKIIDSRYPYEYEGGHIQGAVNLYTEEQIIEEYSRGKTEPSNKRNILIFHCEFSSKRGPKLSLFLRSHDRKVNALEYPALKYPELYILHGGYKAFYEASSDLCTPQTYRTMVDPAFTAEYNHYRRETKDFSKIPTTASKKKSRSRLIF